MDILKTLDKVDALEEGKRQLSDTELDKAFQDRVETKLKDLLDGAPIWAQEIREYLPAAAQVIARVGKTKFAGDERIAELCKQLQDAIAAPEAVERGLAEFEKFKATWRSDVLRYGLTNAINEILFNVPQLLTSGRGRRESMERTSKRSRFDSRNFSISRRRSTRLHWLQ